MQMNVRAARSQLSKLIAAAEAGEDVVIARRGRPAVRLVPVPAPARKTGPGFAFDALKHLVTEVPDFDDDPMDDEVSMDDDEAEDGRPVFGIDEGRFAVPDDFDAPLDEALLRAFEGRE